MDSKPTDSLMGHDMVVISRDNKTQGKVVGTRRCTLEGCRAQRLGVRWPDGKITWPCKKGMTLQEDGWHFIC